MSNRVGERVGKLSLSSAQNRVKSCHWTLYSMKNRARPFWGGSRHALAKVRQTVSSREVGKSVGKLSVPPCIRANTIARQRKSQYRKLCALSIGN